MARRVAPAFVRTAFIGPLRRNRNTRHLRRILFDRAVEVYNAIQIGMFPENDALALPTHRGARSVRNHFVIVLRLHLHQTDFVQSIEIGLTDGRQNLAFVDLDRKMARCLAQHRLVGPALDAMVHHRTKIGGHVVGLPRYGLSRKDGRPSEPVLHTRHQHLGQEAEHVIAFRCFGVTGFFRRNNHVVARYGVIGNHQIQRVALQEFQTAPVLGIRGLVGRGLEADHENVLTFLAKATNEFFRWRQIQRHLAILGAKPLRVFTGGNALDGALEIRQCHVENHGFHGGVRNQRIHQRRHIGVRFNPRAGIRHLRQHSLHLEALSQSLRAEFFPHQRRQRLCGTAVRRGANSQMIADMVYGAAAENYDFLHGATIVRRSHTGC